MAKPRPPRLVALADQVAALLRDHPAGMTTTQVWHTLWGPCHGWPHSECHHDVSYTMAYNMLSRLADQGLATRTPPRSHARSAVLWAWAGPPPLPMPPWQTANEEGL